MPVRTGNARIRLHMGCGEGLVGRLLARPGQRRSSGPRRARAVGGGR